MLVQPATVERWHRDRCDRRWWRRSRRPGRPRIDAGCRDLISRLAEENAPWGAPRIHGELLKLKVIVSERTVSRYFQERLKRPSEPGARSWQIASASSHSIPACCSPDADDADMSGLPCRQPRLSRDALHAFHQGAAVDWRDSRQPTSSRRCSIQARVDDGISIRNRSGRGPPTQGGLPTHASTSRNRLFSNAVVSAPNQPARPPVARQNSTSLGDCVERPNVPCF